MPSKSDAIQGAATLPVRGHSGGLQNKIVIWLSLLHYYTTFSGFLAYLFIAWKKAKLSKMDFLFLCGIISLLMAQLVIKEPSAIFIDLRFYWGWIIFYFIFKANVVNEKMLGNAFVLLCVITLVEAILINSVISAITLPNFPVADASMTDFAIPGNYQRPYSFGASATVGSSLLVVLMAISKVRGWRLWLGVFTVFVFASGTGIFILLLFLLVKYPKWMMKASFLLMLATLVMGYFLPQQTSDLFNLYNSKIGPEYLEFLIDFKLSQINEYIDALDTYMIFFGGLGEYRGGDFGFLAFILANGILGLLLFLMILFYRTNKKNRFPIFLIVLSSFHYPVMFFLPGQMIFGWLLSNRKDRVLDKTRQEYNARAIALERH